MHQKEKNMFVGLRIQDRDTEAGIKCSNSIKTTLLLMLCDTDIAKKWIKLWSLTSQNPNKATAQCIRLFQQASATPSMTSQRVHCMKTSPNSHYNSTSVFPWFLIPNDVVWPGWVSPLCPGTWTSMAERRQQCHCVPGRKETTKKQKKRRSVWQARRGMLI